MQNKKIIRFVQSLVLLPITTFSAIPVGPITQATMNMVAPEGTVVVAEVEKSKEDIQAEEDLLKAKALAVDTYFSERNMPLEGMGMKMVVEAEKNELDWRLVAAIAVRESTGGKHACKKATYNSFGWGSCKINFKSNEAAIETVARNLGGNNPNTAHHYDEKTTIQILRAYNPPSIVPRYAEQVIGIMDVIGAEDLSNELAVK